MRAPHTLSVLAALSLSVATLTSSARADDAADVAAARTLGVEGVKLADAGKCYEAVDKLTRAEKLHHAPTVLERLGECQIDLGKIVDGTENLQKVVREELPSGAPTAFVVAKMRAQKALDAAKPKVAKLVIQVSGAKSDDVVVKVDGQNVSSAYLGTARPTDPGDHTLEVSAQGYKTQTKKVTLAPGGSENVALTLEVDPNAKPPDTGNGNGAGNGNGNGGPDKGTTTPPPSGTSGKTIAGVTALAVGGVGLVVGGIFGFLAMGKKSSLDSQCVNKACPTGTQDAIDTANMFATVSTVGFIVGGVGAAAGIVILAIPSGSASASTKGATITPSIGIGSIGVRGTF